MKLIASNHRGKRVPVEPAALELDAGAEATATIRLAVDADTADGSEATVRLTATEDPKPAIGGFNSASKAFTVIRE